ncbi:MAG TPA: ABC transporter ATP-binding protein [Solirubrobacteraceae bacterium]|jgi:ABC-type polysaccharide/polyol phosphate transport system ATPase subunit|nr:ABC transporter ATP-binding protein [Solirubrobacteraceae bacterium]
MGPASPAVEVSGISKTFTIPRERVHTFKERALHPLRRAGHDELRALQDVSFQVEPGEFFGIVGRNGSGKSTLLKCLAGIYKTDYGRIYVNGRLSTFIELGVGFNMDLAARDNVLLNATMLGVSQREARRRFDQILEFAELEEFVDLKLKNYSSGMLVRLAFAVMIQVDADILLIDEVLAVGDAAFQQKCYDEFARIRRQGTTVLLVTHDMASVKRFCDRAMLLEHGRVVEIGDPDRVGNRYLELNFDPDARDGADAAGPPAEATGAEAPEPEGDGAADVVAAWFQDAHGKPIAYLPLREPCMYLAKIRFNADVVDPVVSMEMRDDQDTKVFGCSSERLEPLGSFSAGDELLFMASFDAVFAPGRYFLTPAIAHGDHRLIQRRDTFTSVVIAGDREGDWLAHLPVEIGVERTVAAPETVTGTG